MLLCISSVTLGQSTIVLCQGSISDWRIEKSSVNDSFKSFYLTFENEDTESNYGIGIICITSKLELNAFIKELNVLSKLESGIQKTSIINDDISLNIFNNDVYIYSGDKLLILSKSECLKLSAEIEKCFLFF